MNLEKITKQKIESRIEHLFETLECDDPYLECVVLSLLCNYRTYCIVSDMYKDLSTLKNL